MKHTTLCSKIAKICGCQTELSKNSVVAEPLAPVLTQAQHFLLPVSKKSFPTYACFLAGLAWQVWWASCAVCAALSFSFLGKNRGKNVHFYILFPDFHQPYVSLPSYSKAPQLSWAHIGFIAIIKSKSKFSLLTRFFVRLSWHFVLKIVLTNSKIFFFYELRKICKKSRLKDENLQNKLFKQCKIRTILKQISFLLNISIDWIHWSPNLNK